MDRTFSSMQTNTISHYPQSSANHDLSIMQSISRENTTLIKLIIEVLVGAAKFICLIPQGLSCIMQLHPEGKFGCFRPIYRM